jgi:RNA polymerase sigma-70 factor (ECF subfamily)
MFFATFALKKPLCMQGVPHIRLQNQKALNAEIAENFRGRGEGPDRQGRRESLRATFPLAIQFHFPMNPMPDGGVWHFVRRKRMRELTLIRPGRTADAELVLDLEKTALRQEFEERLSECGTLAFRVARGVLRNAADAEDVAQEALLQAYRCFGRLRDPSRFRAWLVRISFRLALDEARTARRREHREATWAVNVPRPTAEDLAASREFERRLERAMETLPRDSRLVLLLASMDGHSLNEVAELLQIPIGTVKSRLHSARKRLAEKLR